jgi:hypothetical protein
MFGNPEAFIRSPATVRPCQHLVGKFCGRPTGQSSDNMGRIQGGLPRTLHTRRCSSQYAIDQVNTDLKKKNCFMRGLNDRLQRKMATCINLTYGRAVSTALAVEAKYAGTGKSKGFGGDRPSQGPVKRQQFVIRPSNQNRSFSHPPSFPFK